MKILCGFILLYLGSAMTEMPLPHYFVWAILLGFGGAVMALIGYVEFFGGDDTQPNI